MATAKKTAAAPRKRAAAKPKTEPKTEPVADGIARYVEPEPRPVPDEAVYVDPYETA